ncbi:MAG: tetratricopeptide repeat protein [Armatimonadetes bacterium]|nr:tetratricopeptide repeat protein [Armatimonadota bacterium]
MLASALFAAAPIKLLVFYESPNITDGDRILSSLRMSVASHFATASGLQVMNYTEGAAPIQRALADKVLTKEDLRRASDVEGMQKIVSALDCAGGVWVKVDKVQSLDDVDIGMDVSLTLTSKDRRDSFPVAGRASKYEAKYATGSQRRTVYDAVARLIVAELNTRTVFFSGTSSPGSPAPAATVQTPSHSSPAVTSEGLDLSELVGSTDPDQALRRLKDASIASPRDPSLYVAAGDLYLRKGKIDDAILEYKRAAYVDSKHKEALFKLAKAYSQRGDMEKALETAQRLVGLGFDSAAVRQLTAQGHLALQTFHEANGRLEPAKAELKKALDDLHKATDLDQNNVEVLWTYGKLLQSADQDKEAAIIYRRLTDLSPQNAETWQAFSFSLLGVGDYVGGLTALERSLELRPTRPVSYDSATYQNILRLTDGRAREIYLQARSDLNDYADKKISAEKLLEQTEKLFGSVNRLTALMGNLEPPESKQRTHLQKTLSYQLLQQAAFALVSYVETHDDAYQEKATLLLVEFANEYESARKKPTEAAEAPTLKG